MAVSDKRGSSRKPVHLTTYIRKELPAGGYSLMQFVSRDLSEGGVFVSTDDVSLFDLGEEISVIVDRGGKRLYEGGARVVRSSRVFDSREAITESGFGLMFAGDGSPLLSMVKKQLESSQR